MFWVSRRNRLRLTVGLLIGFFVIGAILVHTHGDGAAAGQTYNGTVIVTRADGQRVQRLPFSFRVDEAGNAVEDFHFQAGLPRLCSRTVIASLGTLGATTAPIIDASRFLARVPIDQDGARVGTLIVSGIFHSLKREAGAVETTYSQSALSACAATGGYSAKA